MALGSTITQVTESGIKPGITWPSFVSSGVATATNFKTGTTDVHSTGVTAATVVVGSAVTGNSTGLDITGIVTATSFSGSGANLTSIPAGQLTGTVADARISTLTSSKLSGALPAIDGSALIGVASTEYIHSSTNAVLSGIVTTGPLNSSTGNFSSNVTIFGNLGVAGTVTYEDVARVDATGLSTFREGFGVGPLAGLALTAYKDGSIRTSGIVTAGSYYGDGANLSNLPATAPVGGATTNKVFFNNDQTVSVTYSIPANTNSGSFGPITVAAGQTVTIPSGSYWTIV